MKSLFVFLSLCLFSLSSYAQDTFYVKKKTNPTQLVQSSVIPDYEKDSIISYTVEYLKPGTNTWVVLHLPGPYLIIPSEAYTKDGGTRVWFRDIIAVDATGKKYKQPDRMWKSGVWVTMQGHAK